MAEKIYNILNPCHTSLGQSTICEYDIIKSFAKTTHKTLKGGEVAVLLMPSMTYKLTEHEYKSTLINYSDILQNDEYFKKNSVTVVTNFTNRADKS